MNGSDRKLGHNINRQHDCSDVLSQQHHQAIHSGQATVDCQHLLNGLAHRFNGDGNVTAVFGVFDCEWRVDLHSQLVSNTSHDASREVVLSSSDDLERKVAWKCVATFKQFHRRQLNHGLVSRDFEGEEMKRCIRAGL